MAVNCYCVAVPNVHMQKIQQGIFRPLQANTWILTRCVVSVMFYEPISCPSMTVDDQSDHKTPLVLRFSLVPLRTAYVPVMTTAQVISLVMDLLSGGVITCTILTHS